MPPRESSGVIHHLLIPLALSSLSLSLSTEWVLIDAALSANGTPRTENAVQSRLTLFLLRAEMGLVRCDLGTALLPMPVMHERHLRLREVLSRPAR